MNGLVSIIIPVYNLEGYLHHSVESALNQTYKNIEIILIDDGSADGSGTLCDQYAAEHENIRVIHQPNSGVCAARNTGLDAADGAYIMFLDGDDFISPHAVEVLLNDLSGVKDCIYSGFSYKKIHTQNFESCEPVSSPSYYETDEILHGLLGNGYENIGVCAKLYPKTRIEHLRFVVGRSHNEDKFFLFQYIMENPGIISERTDALYGYYSRPGSATQSGYNPRILDVLYFSDRILQEVTNKKPELLNAAKHNDIVAHLIVEKCIVRANKYQMEKKTFTEVKQSMIEKYDAESKAIFGAYWREYKILKFSDWLYCLCVMLVDRIKK